MATVKPRRNATFNNVAVIIGKFLDKAFFKHNCGKGFHVRGIYPLNEYIFVEDEFLSSCVTDRPWCQVTEPASVSLSSKDNSEQCISVGFLKASVDLIRTFHNNGPKNWEKENGKSRIQSDTPEYTKIEKQRAQK